MPDLSGLWPLQMWLTTPPLTSNGGGFLFMEKPMIPISYKNVMNGLNKSLSMRLLCPTRGEVDYLFHRACELWYVKDFSQASRREGLITYGSVRIHFQNIEAIHNDSWRGFRGVFLLHPSINPDNLMPRHRSMYDEMVYHNERYLEQWRS